MLGDQLHFVVSDLLGQGKTHGSERDGRELRKMATKNNEFTVSTV
jgi:hypothetical protein